jgi:hypothetical protein
MTIRRARTSITVQVMMLCAACASDAHMPSDLAPAGTVGGPAAGTGVSWMSPAAGMDVVQAGTVAEAGAPAAGTGAAGVSGTAGQGEPGPVTAGASGEQDAGAAGAAGGGGMPEPPVETVPTLYWLDINANRVMRSENFAAGRAIVTRTGTAPDGVSVDVAGGKIYWTNMGSLLGSGGGTLQRANLDGSGVETIIPAGVARTPKQMQLDLVHRQLYFCDREGAKVWRANMDGSNPVAIVSGHGFRELVGVALDVPAGKFYFSDRIGRKILRANIDMPAGETGANRTDIEEMITFPSGAMPIDLDIDHDNGMLYWTDRGRATVHRAGLEIPAGQTAGNRRDLETLVTGVTEAIGISLDVPNDKMYFSELGGNISESALDGSGLRRNILRSGSATGVAIAHIPKP